MREAETTRGTAGSTAGAAVRKGAGIRGSGVHAARDGRKLRRQPSGYETTFRTADGERYSKAPAERAAPPDPGALESSP